jgi:hypothetical protein
MAVTLETGKIAFNARKAGKSVIDCAIRGLSNSQAAACT